MKTCNCGGCRVESGAVALEQPHTDSCGCEHSLAHHAHGGHGSGRGGEISSLRQDVIAVILSVLLFAGALFVPAPAVKTVLLAAAVLIAGAPIFWEGLKRIVRFDFEEMSLLTVAVVAAVCIGELSEAVIVTILFRLGEILEELAIDRSQRKVEAVTKILPDSANLVTAQGIQTVSARTLPVGSTILVKSGERLPVDCRVLSGSSSVDQSSLTGESLPRAVEAGDKILSSAINLGGVLTCETTSTFDDSAASKIIEMVRDAAAKKDRTERLISRFARVYTPIVMLLAAVAVLPPLLGFGEFSAWIHRALVFLVAACPCALVIATPLVFFGGIGALSGQGVLVKGSRYIEALAKADSVVFDKTGTLTTGRPQITEIIPAGAHTAEEVLRLAAICESGSNHPLAQAVIAAAGEIDAAALESCEEITAQGMRAVIGGEQVLCGSERLMLEHGVDTAGLPGANLYVAQGGGIIGAIRIADRARPEAAQAVRELAALGVTNTAMLTGDGPEAARQVQAETGIAQVYANLLPGDKVSRFGDIKEATPGATLYVGDGINDSPVLARSDAGVAMGLASDAAIQAADVVLLSDSLVSLPQAVRISRRTARLARGIIAFALGVKLLVLLLAFLGAASMWMAVFADVGVSIISVLLATAALRYR